MVRRGFASAVALGLTLAWVGGCVRRAPEDPMRSRGFDPALSTAEALGQALEPRRIAVLLGVDGYADPSFPPLAHAGADARSLAEVLRDPDGGGFDEVVLLTDPEDTSRERLLEALRRVRAGLRREDTLVVYFSGHGTRVPDGERWRRFLLTQDSRAANLAATAIDLAELQSWLTALPAVRKALVVDACFSGDGKSVVRPGAPSSDLADDTVVEPDVPLGPGEVHLFATSAGRPSRESDNLGHGVYSYYLLEGMSWGFSEADLDGDGLLTAWEAHDYARGRTLEFTEGIQVPEASVRVVGEADLVLAGAPGVRRRREKALVYLYAGAQHALHGARVVIDGRARGSLPGTLSVAPGRHRIEIRGPDGTLAVDGAMFLGSGRAYRVDDLERIAHGETRAAWVRGTALASPRLAEAIGDGATGVEVGGLLRAARGPARGLYGALAGAVMVSPSRPGEPDPRPVLQLDLSGGWQRDLRRLRLRGGLGVSVWDVPPDWPGGRVLSTDLDPLTVPANAGWWAVAAGPELGLGFVVSDGWTLAVQARSHGALLDLDGGGTLSWVPWHTIGVGPELSW